MRQKLNFDSSFVDKWETYKLNMWGNIKFDIILFFYSHMKYNNLGDIYDPTYLSIIWIQTDHEQIYENKKKLFPMQYKQA